MIGSILDEAVQRREPAKALRYAPTHGGRPPDDPFWRHVERRFDLAVATGHFARFEHYHPVMRRLESLAKLSA